MQVPYYDPRTNLRYANADVFKIVRSLPKEYVQSYLALRNAAVVLKQLWTNLDPTVFPLKNNIVEYRVILKKKRKEKKEISKDNPLFFIIHVLVSKTCSHNPRFLCNLQVSI